MHRKLADLEAGLGTVLAAPADGGRVELIVRRPAVDAREVLDAAALDPDEGLVGDSWRARGSGHNPDGSAYRERQLTLMSARVAALVAGDVDRWPLAGDQLYVDLDLSAGNLPPGTLLALGAAVIEVTAEPHLGCAKFAARFGRDALRFVNAPERHPLRLRGANAKVVTAGVVRRGDPIHKRPRRA